MSHIKTLTNGIFRENPTFGLVLGMCPTLATTTSAANGMGMGAATTFVLVMSNLVISLVANLIPDKIRIPAFTASCWDAPKPSLPRTVPSCPCLTAWAWASASR